MVELTPSQQCQIVEALRDDYSVREICETLGFHRSLLYYHPKSDPSEAVLEEQIEQLCGRYPTYGYRRITQLLANEGIHRWVSPRCPIDEKKESLGIGETGCLSNHYIA